MPALWKVIPEVNNMNDWFPIAESMPITVRQAIDSAEIQDAPYLSPGLRAIVGDIPQWGDGGDVTGGNYFGTKRLGWDKPSRTIIKEMTGTRTALVHPSEPRAITLSEAKRIGSWPDSFSFLGDYKNGMLRIGNSVPPLFMRSIARNIKSMLQTGQPIRQSSKLSKVDDYPAFLDACWQEHLAPRAADAPTVVSTFAGAGGSSLGYSMAGFRELLAVEWDDNAVATFKLNFPDVPVYHGDIAKLSVEDVLQRTGLQPGELDVFDGSPPCQGFSTAGKRDFYDDRNQLFREYVRLLRGLQPKVLIMENVSGMVKGKMKLVFADILRELKVSGYRVSARLLNAMYFNVPQSRERMIFVGVREDLGIEPSHPQAQSVPVTVAQAWVGAKSEGKRLPESAAALARLIPQGDSNGGGKYSKGLNGTTNNFGLSRLAWNKPSCTIPKTSILNSSILQPDKEERISIEQAQRLGSYPDEYTLIGDFEAKWARIGNSVPPLMMRSVAKHIRAEILARIEATNAP